MGFCVCFRAPSAMSIVHSLSLPLCLSFSFSLSDSPISVHVNRHTCVTHGFMLSLPCCCIFNFGIVPSIFHTLFSTQPLSVVHLLLRMRSHHISTICRGPSSHCTLHIHCSTRRFEETPANRIRLFTITIFTVWTIWTRLWIVRSHGPRWSGESRIYSLLNWIGVANESVLLYFIGHTGRKS